MTELQFGIIGWAAAGTIFFLGAGVVFLAGLKIYTEILKEKAQRERKNSRVNFRDLGQTMPSSNSQPVRKRRAVEMRENGASYGKIARELGVSRGTVLNYIKDYPYSRSSGSPHLSPAPDPEKELTP